MATSELDMRLPWWSRRATLVLLVALAMVPLLCPSIPPLTDLPGHMGRYRVALAPVGTFSGAYDFHWQLIGNLGVDLLVVPLARVFGLELAVKIVVIAIPALTVAAMLWLAREVHGRVPPTALFALPLAYGHPLIFGFVNYALAMGLALGGVALWLAMARWGALRWRAPVFAVVGLTVWLAHAFGWGLLGATCFFVEVARLRATGRSWWGAVWRAGVACLPLALPLVPMLAWRADSAANVTGWFLWHFKAEFVVRTLRDRWMAFDLLGLALIGGIIVYAALGRRFRFDPGLTMAALALAALFALMPMVVFASYYADMRMTPFIVALALLAIGPIGDNPWIARAGLAFFALRIAAHTASFVLADARAQQALAALDHVPRGARVAAFVGHECGRPWAGDRLDHLPSLAIVRRDAFVNAQWGTAGASPLMVSKADAPGFIRDPSQLVSAVRCRGQNTRTLDAALATFPRAAFDYVWLIDPPRHDARGTRGLVTVWADGRDRLYRIVR